MRNRQALSIVPQDCETCRILYEVLEETTNYEEWLKDASKHSLSIHNIDIEKDPLFTATMARIRERYRWSKLGR